MYRVRSCGEILAEANRKRRLLDRHTDSLKSLAASTEALGTCESYDIRSDQADAAFQEEHSHLTSCLAEHEDRARREIEEALSRLREGTYGVCEKCGDKIALERLNALPAAAFCITCQRDVDAELEQEKRGDRRQYGRCMWDYLDSAW